MHQRQFKNLKIIKEIDNRILINEKNVLLKNSLKWHETVEPLPIYNMQSCGLEPFLAYTFFMARFEELTK